MYYEIDGTAVRLAGSMHLGPTTSPNLPDWVWGAYDWSEEVIFEADLATVRDHIFLQEGDSLDHHLSAMERLWLCSAHESGRFPGVLAQQTAEIQSHDL